MKSLQLQALHPIPSASKRKAALLLGVFGFVLGGCALEFGIGANFVFFFSSQYQAVGKWAFALLLLLVGLALRTEQMANHLRQRYPTWWVRRLLVYPLFAALIAAMVVLAPLGWIAALVWATGEPTAPTAGRLVSVGEYRASTKGCDQRGELVIRGHTARLCLEGLATLPLKGGVPITVVGKLSPMGLLVTGLTDP